MDSPCLWVLCGLPRKGKLLTAVKLIILRMFYGVAMKLGFIRSLRAFFPLWAASKLIYVGPADAGARLYPETRALQQVTDDLRITDEELHRQLEHPCANVVGYCLEALLARRSPLLARLPASLYKRREPVAMGLGCLFAYQPLCDYVLARSRYELCP